MLKLGWLVIYILYFSYIVLLVTLDTHCYFQVTIYSESEKSVKSLVIIHYCQLSQQHQFQLKQYLIRFMLCNKGTG